MTSATAKALLTASASASGGGAFMHFDDPLQAIAAVLCAAFATIVLGLAAYVVAGIGPCLQSWLSRKLGGAPHGVPDGERAEPAEP